MVRKDEVGLLAHEQPVAHVVPEPPELGNLVEERLGIDHHAVADDARDVLMEDAGWQQAQNDLPVVHIHRVAGIVSALVSRDDGKVRRQQINDLALALVTPLCAEYSNVHGGHILPCPPELRAIPTNARPK